MIVYARPAFFILGLISDLPPSSKVGAVCSSAACTDLSRRVATKMWLGGSRDRPDLRHRFSRRTVISLLSVSNSDGLWD